LWRTFDANDAELRMFIANRSNIAVRRRSKRCLCFFHVLEFDYGKTLDLRVQRSWPLDVHKRAATGKKFAALIHDCFHGDGDKLFEEGVLVHYIDLEVDGASRLRRYAKIDRGGESNRTLKELNALNRRGDPLH
jgi:hypothetical protein